MDYQKFDNDAEEDDDSAKETTQDEVRIEVEDIKTNQPEFFAKEKRQNATYIDDPSALHPPKTRLEAVQRKVQSVVEHIAFRLATVFLIVLDFILVIIELSIDPCDNGNGMEVVSHIIITYFVIEVCARIFYKGADFFRSWIDVVDMVIVLISFIVEMVFAGLSGMNRCNKISYAKLLVIGRAFRIFRIVRTMYFLFTQKRQVAQASRKIVSQNKRRYQKDGFDLDLCYITERVIAMSFPSKGLMAMYRNPIREVARFLDTKHRDHYKVYNLCSERDYDESLFHDRVERIHIDDHNVPTIHDMIKFAASAKEWMSEDENNIIAVHCKGGKGRTGTMICVWLVESGLFEQAQDSLDYFGDRRTDLNVGTKFQGVETPSQSRYVGYFEIIKKELGGEAPRSKRLKMKSVKIAGLRGVGKGDGSDFSMEIYMDRELKFDCNFGASRNCQVMRYADAETVVCNLTNAPVLEGDIKVRFTCTSNIPRGYENCPFYFWFNTSFIEENRLHLLRQELDNPHKKKTWHVFKENFVIDVTFEDAE
ncbi:phosphatidylinositol 3,4,5-trisphosphate 3-phosphatase TPTE2-like [Liolophura sinensis]|uniref:phosphatidylinositol 3,4,5-trisphosphate 3-phosphatase TPTE2-like n=1 Tax=Liolophura sinensis TaxID=3198878 RepID=UPI0031587F6B